MTSTARIDDLRSRLDREPGSRLFAQLAEELRKAGRLDEAIHVAREGLARHPGYASARLTLGRALCDLGDFRSARGELETVVAEAPDNILACRLLAEALEKLGLREEAAARHRAVLELAPGDTHALERLEALALEVTSAPAPQPAAAPPSAPWAPAVPDDVGFVDETLAAEEAPGAAPIPLAQVDEEEFEIERPTDTTARLMSLDDAVPLAVPDAPLREEPAPAAAAAEPAPGELEDFGAGREELVFDFAEEADAPTLPFAEMPPAISEEPVVPLDEGEPEPAAPPAPTAEAAPPLVVEGTGARASDRRPLSTPTLAELYYNQGVPDRAAEVYRQIVEREPWNERARRRLEEIEARLGEAASLAAAAVPRYAPPADRREALERTIARLEVFLRLVKEGRAKWPASPTR